MNTIAAQGECQADALQGVDPEIDYESFVTEDNKPVDRILIEKLHRLLTEPLYTNWPGPGDERTFLVLADVGWFYQLKTPAVAPDCLLSLDVTLPENLRTKRGHSYYQWDMGKQPDVIVEIVSDRTGGEETFKKGLYARLGVPYYIVYDPDELLDEGELRVYHLHGGRYRLGDNGPWPGIGLGIRLWQGTYEGALASWPRWCDDQGTLIPTGAECKAALSSQVEQAKDRIKELEAELKRLRGKTD